MQQQEARKYMDAPVNRDFVQVTRSYLPEWRALVRKSPVASEILLFFIEHMGKNHNAVVASYTALTELTGRSRATVARAVKTLKDDNWIETVRISNATAYAVNERVAWRSHANQRQYAMFSATVVASSSEQSGETTTGKLKQVPTIESVKNV